MRVLGFNQVKISGEKTGKSPENIKVNSSIDISEISQIATDVINSKEALLSVIYLVTFDYTPDYAKIELKGSFVVEMEKSKAEKILGEWKNKKLDEEVHLSLTNLILRRAHVKALQLEEELGIPFHFKLPLIGK